MKKIIMCCIALMLSGCSFPEEYQTAINNYAKAECDSRQGRLTYVTERTIDGTIESTFVFRCVTEKGVETHTYQLKNIPVKYWSK